MSVKKILISQQQPKTASPYTSIAEKFGVEMDFKPFFKIEPLTSREFRSQRINILDHTAIVFSARTTIDAFFQLCEELRVKVPETMKYFCTTEAVANYLQKHIVYRKRKIFFGDGTPESIIGLIGTKHKGENFLIATSGTSGKDAVTKIFETQKFAFETAVFVKPVSQDIKDVDLHSYDLIVLFNPADVISLHENHPEFNQGDIKFISYGRSIVKAMEEAGLTIEISAPTPEVPSVAKAIETYLTNHQK
jgi:uroporphyrinogen-III synthase